MDAHAYLSYNIAEMKLTGMVNSQYISCVAYSGGRGGSKTPGATNDIIMNNPFLTGLKHDKGDTIGGPLPLGWYKLQKHETKPNWIRLIPTTGQQMLGRSDFAIHGRGAIGSQGCIVPRDFLVVQKLYKIVKQREEKKQRPVLLQVFASGDLDYYLKKLTTA